MCVEVPSHFLWLHFAFWWAEGKKVSLPGPTGEANFADLMSFLSVPTGNPHAPGKVLRLQKEPEKRETQWGQFVRKRAVNIL